MMMLVSQAIQCEKIARVMKKLNWIGGVQFEILSRNLPEGKLFIDTEVRSISLKPEKFPYIILDV